MNRRGLAILLLVLLYVLNSCQEKNKKSPDDQAWESVMKSENPDTYMSYVSKYPNGKHIASAMKKIEEGYSKMMNDTTSLLASYDAYKEAFPNGKLLDLYEEKIYEYASLKGDSAIVSVYQSRFPAGKYLQTVEAAGEDNDFEKVKAGAMTMKVFLMNYPNTSRKPELEKWLADSVQKVKNLALYNQYVNLFPEGDNMETIQKLEEEILYQEVVKSKKAQLLLDFLEKFPTSSFVSKTVLITHPKDVEIEVLDTTGNVIQKMMSRDTLYAVDGDRVWIKINNPDFKEFSTTIDVDKNRPVEDFKLKYSSKFIVFEKFSDANSLWAKSGSDYSAKVEDGKLLLATSSSQVEILKKQKIDFKRDFSLQIRFKFVEKKGKGIAYVGLLWGDNLKTNYFFVSMDGKAGAGNKDSRALSSDNNFGYDGWSRSWLSAQTYKRDDFNEMIVTKVGKNVRYTLNGLSISAFQLMNTPRDRYIGIGIGQAKVMIDQIILKQ